MNPCVTCHGIDNQHETWCQDAPACMVCGIWPCDCDHQYELYADRKLGL